MATTAHLPADFPAPTILVRTPYDLAAGMSDQSEVERRDDVLVHTAPPVTDGLEITGPVEVEQAATNPRPRRATADQLQQLSPWPPTGRNCLVDDHEPFMP